MSLRSYNDSCIPLFSYNEVKSYLSINHGWILFFFPLKWIYKGKSTMRTILTITAFSLLLQGCSWTFIEKIPNTVQTTEQEKQTVRKDCRKNMKSHARLGDVLSSLLYVPGLVLGAALIGDKHDSISGAGGLFTTFSLVGITAHLLSLRYGQRNVNKCKALLKRSQ